MHGHFAEAFHYNYLLVILLPYLTLLGIEELLLTGKTKERWKRVIEGRTLVITMIILVNKPVNPFGLFSIRTRLN